MLGVDPELVLPDDAVATLRQQRAKAQAQAQQQQAIEQQAAAAQKLGNTPTQGGGSTALDDAIGMFSGYTNNA